MYSSIGIICELAKAVTARASASDIPHTCTPQTCSFTLLNISARNFFSCDKNPRNVHICGEKYCNYIKVPMKAGVRDPEGHLICNLTGFTMASDYDVVSDINRIKNAENLESTTSAVYIPTIIVHERAITDIIEYIITCMHKETSHTFHTEAIAIVRENKTALFADKQTSYADYLAICIAAEHHARALFAALVTAFKAAIPKIAAFINAAWSLIYPKKRQSPRPRIIFTVIFILFLAEGITRHPKITVIPKLPFLATLQRFFRPAALITRISKYTIRLDIPETSHFSSATVTSEQNSISLCLTQGDPAIALQIAALSQSLASIPQPPISPF